MMIGRSFSDVCVACLCDAKPAQGHNDKRFGRVKGQRHEKGNVGTDYSRSINSFIFEVVNLFHSVKK